MVLYIKNEYIIKKLVKIYRTLENLEKNLIMYSFLTHHFE